MGECPVNLLVGTEVEVFGGHSERALVIERDAVHSYQCRDQLKCRSGISSNALAQ